MGAGAMQVTEFKDIRILMIGEKGHGRSLLRTLLNSLGLSRVAFLDNTGKALQSLRREQFDIVFCDEEAGPLSPTEFIKSLRRDLETCDVTIPVILISAGASRRQIVAARDSGANDVIAKPVSAETIRRKLGSLVLQPQTFVTAKSFLGPDRRRTGDDRRQFGERRPFGEDRRGTASDGSVFLRGPRIKTDEDAT